MEIFASTKVSVGFRHKIFLNPSSISFDQKKYRGMIGFLLYLTASCLDIMFSACLCARFYVNLKMYHLLAVKNIKIWYPTNASFLLQAYFNSNYGGHQLDRKEHLEVVNLWWKISQLVIQEIEFYYSLNVRSRIHRSCKLHFISSLDEILASGLWLSISIDSNLM